MLRETTRKLKFDRLVQLFDRALPGSGFAWAFTVERIWHIAAENAPDGAIGRALSDEEIEAGVRWPGEPGKYVAALVEARWLDRVDGDVRLYIHDWHDHADRSVHMRLAREGRLFANGSMPNVNYLNEKDRDAARRRYACSMHAAHGQHVQSSGQGQALGQGHKNQETPAPAGAAEEAPLDPNAPDVKFATDFSAALRRAHGEAVKVPELDSKTFRKRWVAEARLLFDDVGEPCARQVARWLFRGEDEDATWWRPNILSLAKFRSKFATLRMRMETRARASPKSVRGGGAEDALAELGKALGYEVNG